MNAIKIGIIGLGTIGHAVASYSMERYAEQIEVKAALVRNESRDYRLPASCLITSDEDAFFAEDMDIIVEAAGHTAVKTYGVRALRHASFIVASIGALAEANVLKELRATAAQYHTQLLVPSAAIGGLDRICAMTLEEIDRIELITRKPPVAWYGTFAEEKVELSAVSEPTLIFNGTANESALLFPESVNVSAALSLAGIGFENTHVQVYVDPTITRNTHQIIVEGFAGRIKLSLQNTPSAHNPKTGYIVAMSIVKVLRQYTNPFVIGV
ncbi:aspartate dehydrogenase [Aneurinibacillus aneurinilyticus]|uniref:aspartate dehydrogenase n=1 Tax=Aneurinibacillus aneurinilyticus TaxID=1391 RepID=UPI00041808E5|nr:aspartate dehydrogenase [Aneurinibacillus aneurinilyticus]MED0708590.1 aspartate dehydrogenase [Aneurinibacillus aneurinilyticus]MED0721750.1 aspartate dehydrogenase [Aneurinibacillus aneurinilyticus]MED0731874.1 aspartate dehydrogenase [Aneurinibacillus aneurinilyticus]MED0740545.1 aspartate dehydrogenase [Aneurinibacillus aneurinilyticus]